MSGFTAEWLALREPVDHRSRSPRITAAVRDWATARWTRTGRPLQIIDLGAGTGSNCRYLSEHLPLPQSWRLVDRDAALLEEAANRLDRGPNGRGLPPTILRVEMEVVDLTEANLAELVAGADLVTASALFDLMSERSLRAMMSEVARPGHAFLAALTYDGSMRWALADPDDAHLTRLVNQHQLSDKGFGPALGPNACELMEELVKETDGRGKTADSDWVLGPDDGSLQGMLLPTWAHAARTVAPNEASLIDGWLQRRMAAIATIGSLLVVGHRDLFAAW
jgi:hypothetical protein